MIDAVVNSQSPPVLSALRNLVDLSTGLNQEALSLIEEIIVASPLLTRSTSEFLDIVLEVQKHHAKLPITNIKEQAILAVGSLISLVFETDKSHVDKYMDRLVGPLEKDKSQQSDYKEEVPLYIEALKNSDQPKCMEFMEQIWNFTSSSKLTLSALHYLQKSFRVDSKPG